MLPINLNGIKLNSPKDRRRKRRDQKRSQCKKERGKRKSVKPSQMTNKCCQQKATRPEEIHSRHQVKDQAEKGIEGKKKARNVSNHASNGEGTLLNGCSKKKKHRGGVLKSRKEVVELGKKKLLIKTLEIGGRVRFRHKNLKRIREPATRITGEKVQLAGKVGVLGVWSKKKKNAGERGGVG